VTRDQVIAAIRKSSAKLGHVPSIEELVNSSKVTRQALRKIFGSYREAWRASGLDRQGSGYKVELNDLFLDWAGVVRTLGRAPTIADYNKHSRYSCRPLVSHYGGWSHVPAGLLAYARKAGLQEQWKEVLEIAAASARGPHGQHRRLGRPGGIRSRQKILANVPIYGEPMMPAPLTYAPTNEMGVVFLFGAMARELGFAVTRLQSAFPDCEAMREMGPEWWQPSRIEFEYESRNFLLHQHSAAKCDLIICWRHNWPECPVEVLELRSVMRQKLATDEEGSGIFTTEARRRGEKREIGPLRASASKNHE
jgi:Homing endonuclease associated repeat